MVIMPEPVFAAVEAVQADGAEPGELILLTPAGERLTQPLVRELANTQRLLLLCGRYEGFDERIRLGLRPREISIGDFVCNGGEVPAMVVIDTVVRYVPGVLGDETSVAEESHSDAGPTGVSAIHPAPRLSRHDRAGRSAERQPRGDRPLAARTSRNPAAGGPPAADASPERTGAMKNKLLDPGRRRTARRHAQVRDRRHGRRPPAHPGRRRRSACRSSPAS